MRHLLIILSITIFFVENIYPRLYNLKINNVQNSQLKILTINVWSGLDYNGIFNMGEYETDEIRGNRFKSLVPRIKEISPDIIFIQEANPVSEYTTRLADSLNFNEIHHVCNAGFKLGPVGIPSNLKEGMAILANKTLNLELYDIWKLSGSFGLYGDIFSLHFDESIFAVVGKVIIKNRPFYLVNVHLSATPPMDERLLEGFEQFCNTKKLSIDNHDKTLAFWQKKINKRKCEIEQLLSHIKNIPAEYPVIVGGDFNMSPEDSLMNYFYKSGSFTDSFKKNSDSEVYSWNPEKSYNISFSTDQSKIDSSDIYNWLVAKNNKQKVRLDYILISDHFKEENIHESRIVFNSLKNGVLPSDHFGLVTSIDVDDTILTSPEESDIVSPLKKSIFEPLPILSYDTDTGFGYGTKAFLLNYLNLNESLDLILFQSTKGERWYRTVFSIPDFELRQGKIYPWAFDLLIDYDKWISYKFFGVGNKSKTENEEVYKRRLYEIGLTASRGFSPYFVGQFGVRYKNVINSNFEEESQLSKFDRSRVEYTSAFINLRYDSRNSFLNPSRGIVLQGEIEKSLNQIDFTHWQAWIQYYTILLYPKTVFATRFGLNTLNGTNLPIQVLLPIGGNNTLRGFPQDRFLDKTAALFNAELRLPIYNRLGGLIGWDAGKVWQSLNKVDYTDWATNTTLGLRYYMDTFVVRLDIGFSKETMGFYLNFGHIF